MKEVFIIFSLIFVGIGFAIGLCAALEGKNGACDYRNIASRLNIGYIIGCELAKPRFNLGE